MKINLHIALVISQNDITTLISTTQPFLYYKPFEEVKFSFFALKFWEIFNFNLLNTYILNNPGKINKLYLIKTLIGKIDFVMNHAALLCSFSHGLDYSSSLYLLVLGDHIKQHSKQGFQ